MQRVKYYMLVANAKSFAPLIASTAMLVVSTCAGQATDGLANQRDLGQFDDSLGYDVFNGGIGEPTNAVPIPSIESDDLAAAPPPAVPVGEPAANCCEYCGRGNSCPPCWYLDEGVRILSRNRPRAQLLAFRMTEFGPREVLNTKSDTYDIAASFTVKLGRYLGRDTNNSDWFLEAAYWGLNEWDLDARANSTNDLVYGAGDVIGGNLFTPFGFDPFQAGFSDVGGFNRVDTIQIDYDHSVNNFELNCWMRPRGRPDRLVLQPNGRWIRQCQPGCYVSYLAGLRTMFIEDGFAMWSRGTLDVNRIVGDEVVTTTVPVSGDYLIETNNYLLGFQLGCDLTYRHCQWSWSGRFRAAPFVNLADQESQILIDADEDPLATPHADVFREAEHEQAAVALELGAAAEYRLSPRLACRLAYDLMWVSGVALAPDQVLFDLNARPELNNNATVFYHGLTLSLDFAW